MTVVYLPLLCFVCVCIVALACVVVLLLLRFSALVCDFGCKLDLICLRLGLVDFSAGVWFERSFRWFCVVATLLMVGGMECLL